MQNSNYPVKYNMPKLVWLNGKTSTIDDASITIKDHAFLYGDGLFEGIGIYNKSIFKLDEHLDRLYHGARYLDFQMQYAQSEFRKIIIEVCKQADIHEGYIRLNLTRGSGLGLDPKHIDNTPNVMVMVSELKLYGKALYESGMNVITSSVRVIPPDILDPRLKCIGRYAANIQAKLQANNQGAHEALMLNKEGYLAECTGDNIFLVHGKKILTPHSSCGILKGITRDTVIDLANKHGYDVSEEFLTIFDIYASDEVFLTGTAAEIIAMSTLDHRKIGDGKPGPVTKLITELYHKETQNGVAFWGSQI